MSAKGFGKLSADVLPALVLLSAVVVLIEVAVRSGLIRSYLFAAPSSVVSFVINNAAYLAYHLSVTIYETFLGFMLAAVLGIVTAVGIVWSTKFEKAVYPYVLAIQLTPKVAVAPLLVLWFGLGLSSKIVISFLVAYFPVVVETVLGLKLVENDLLDLMHSLKATKMQTYTKIRLPNAIPHIINGLEIAITMALIGAIVGEFIAGSEGIGYVIMLSEFLVDTPRMFAAVLVLVAAGLILSQMVRFIERLLIPWKVKEQKSR